MTVNTDQFLLDQSTGFVLNLTANYIMYDLQLQYMCTFIDTIGHGQGQHLPPPLFSLPPLYDALVRDTIVTQPDIKS